MEANERHDRPPNPKVFVYRGHVPLWLGLILAAPLLLFVVSLVAALLVGGAVAALVLPFVYRRRLQSARDNDSIELAASEYRRIDTPLRRIEKSPRALPDDEV